MLALRTFVRRASTERCLNRVTLIGRAGADSQLKGTAEHPVVVFNLATSVGSKTEWHKISIFKPGLRTIAENYVKTGCRMFVDGKISYGHIIDSQGGAIPVTSIIADDIIFLSNSKSSNEAEQSEGEESEDRL